MKASLLLICVFSLTANAYGNECSTSVPDGYDNVYVCTDEALEEIQYCSSSVNTSCVSANITKGLSALRNHSFSNVRIYEPSGVEYTVMSLAKMNQVEKRTLAALLNLVGISKIRFSNYFSVERQDDNLIKALFGAKVLNMPTKIDEVDRVLTRLVESLETMYLLKLSLPDYSFGANICLESLPVTLSGQDIKAKVRSKKVFLQKYLENSDSVSSVNFCNHSGHYGRQEELFIDITK